MTTTTKKAATPRKATTQPAAKKEDPPEVDLRPQYLEMALDWTLRRLYEGAARPFADRHVDRDVLLPEEVKAVIHERISLL